MQGTYALARCEKGAQSGPRAALWSLLLRCEALLERSEASPKLARRTATAQSGMPSSCPKSKQSAVSSFLPSEMTTDNEKYLQTAAEKGNQMRSKGSNEVVGRIDTRANLPRGKFTPAERCRDTRRERGGKHRPRKEKVHQAERTRRVIKERERTRRQKSHAAQPGMDGMGAAGRKAKVPVVVRPARRRPAPLLYRRAPCPPTRCRASGCPGGWGQPVPPPPSWPPADGRWTPRVGDGPLLGAHAQ